MTLGDALTAHACALSAKALRRHVRFTVGYAANDNRPEPEEWR